MGGVLVLIYPNFLQRSLRLRILVMSTLFSLVFGAVLLVLMAKYYTEQHQRQVIAETQASNAVLSQMIDTTLSHRKDALIQFSSLLHNGQALHSVEQLQAMLDQRIVLHHMFNGGLLVLDAQARGLVDSPTFPGRVGTSYQDRPHVMWVAETREPLISSPFLGRRLQTPIFIVNTPILSEDHQLLGFMIGIMRLEQDQLIEKMFEKFKRENERAYLIDLDQGLFVSSSDPQFIFQPIDQWLDASLINALENKQTSGKALNMNGKPVFFSAQPLAQTNWAQVSIIEQSEMLAATHQMLRDMLIIGLVLFLVGLPLFYVLMRRQLKPLCKAAEHLNLSPHQPVPFNETCNQLDEVGQLIHALNGLIKDQGYQREKLEKARQAAEQADATKSRFLAVMSHEIRTPLAGIMGLAEIGISPNNSAEKMRDCLKKIHFSGESLRDLLNDILDLSKLDAGQLNIQAQPFYLKGLIVQLENQFAALAQQKGLTFKIDACESLKPAYCGDRQRIVQVLTNLLSNALKFTDQGKIVLTLQACGDSALPSETNQAWLSFRFEDSGIGISPEQQKRLFQPFQQGDDSVSQFYGGTGLGLSISQELVKLMGGDAIALTSELGKGSCFCFDLPLGECTAAQTAEAKNDWYDTKTPRLPVLSCVTASILIVEDVEINRQVLMEWLTGMGFDCYLAENGEEAVKMVKDTTVDLVLMDKQMPVMNGLEASRIIRSFKPDLPIIGISADVSVEARTLALRAGMNELVSKPLDNQNLLAIIKGLLRLDESSLPPSLPSSDAVIQLPANPSWINPEQGLACANHQVGLYNQMLQGFKAQWPNENSALLAQLELLGSMKQDTRVPSQDYRQAWLDFFKQLHRLKGLCSTLGATGLVLLLENLEEIIAHYDLPDKLFIEKWQDAVAQTLALLEPPSED
ncbi:ATP-binding protein [Thiomicrospira sp. R3]|uniref:hybrid sensor histidine kinase/response regulator n=1 Tax=Thiomicrospira sp. R3 TaxID=3035472 RepID=UPI00259BB3C8|nr:hybrid sensor histidine kinase/response regulator [Thiomicrospira sp. R3]WFE67814.1 ATP-binding protein [Thiomicrospira sp. R3]